MPPPAWAISSGPATNALVWHAHSPRIPSLLCVAPSHTYRGQKCTSLVVNFHGISFAAHMQQPRQEPNTAWAPHRDASSSPSVRPSLFSFAPIPASPSTTPLDRKPRQPSVFFLAPVEKYRHPMGHISRTQLERTGTVHILFPNPKITQKMLVSACPIAWVEAYQVEEHFSYTQTLRDC